MITLALGQPVPEQSFSRPMTSFEGMSNTEHGSGGLFTPAAAFAALGNETRLKILYELWDTAESPIGFTDLRKRVGMRDSSQFSYHLEQLVGPFVEKTDEGYVLRYTGTEVVWAVVMGTYTETAHLDPFETDSSCVRCESPLRARYRDGMLFLECSACEQTHEAGPIPATAFLDRTNDAILDASSRVWRLYFDLLTKGICWGCRGPVTPTVMEDRYDDPERMRYDVGSSPYDIGVNYECEHCTRWASLSIGVALLSHPAVVSFYYDHGIDLNDVPTWELDWCITDRHTTVVSTEPWLARVAIRLGDEELSATVDDELTVTETERTTISASATADDAN